MNRSGDGVGQVVWVETVSSQLLELGLGLGLFRTGLMNNRVLRECSKVK